MAFQTVISKQTLTAADLKNLDGTAVTAPHGPGRYLLFSSPKVNVPNGVNDIEVLVNFENNYPSSADAVPVNYNLTAILETEDDAGNWHPIHGMIQEFSGGISRLDVGNRLHILSYGPAVTPLDVPYDTFAAGEVISRDHRKQGRIPDDFRVCVLLQEKKGAGDPGQFSSIDLTISYNI